MKRKPSLVILIVGIIIIEGLAIYLNMVAHPASQPGLTIFIVALLALIFGLYAVHFSREKKADVKEENLFKPTGRFNAGIYFWLGALVYNVINIILNSLRVYQDDILIYNYLIAVVALLGLIINIVKKKRS